MIEKLSNTVGNTSQVTLNPESSDWLITTDQLSQELGELILHVCELARHGKFTEIAILLNRI